MASAKAGVHVVQLKPITVSERLLEGYKFIKWDDDSTVGTPVTLRVDVNGFFLDWTDQNKETEFLDISSVRDTRCGKGARTPRDAKLRDTVNMGADVALEDKTVTIVYGPDFVNVNYINFCCNSKEVAQEWAGLVLKMAYNLMALNGSAYMFMVKAHTKVLLMKDREGKIPVKNIVKMFAQHKDDRRRVEKALEETGLPCGKNDSLNPDSLNLDKFLRFTKHLVARSELDQIFQRFCAPSKSSKNPSNLLMSVDELVKFLNEEQRDPRLNEILYPYADRAKGRELINTYEPNKENRVKGVFSIEGFLRYLMSDDNAIVAPEKFDLNEDMDQPLNHYFINSSHNTYLTGHQLTGKSSVEIYRQCLLAGCRCIELDCWNGRNSDEEPIITHGYTVVTDIVLKDVLEAIADAAFKTSVYPVVLSFENHCSARQQAKIAHYCRKIFGDMLLTEPLPTHPLKQGVPLPSPKQLMRKIIIKNKKKHHGHRGHKHRQPGASPGVPLEEAALAEILSTSGSGSNVLSSTPERRPVLQTHNSDESGVGTEPRVIEREDSSQLNDSDECASISNVVSKTVVTSGVVAIGASSCDIEDIDSETSDDDDDGSVPPSLAVIDADGETAVATAHIKETEAGAEMSALVIYMEPVRFHSFEDADRRLRSYEISSFVETQATSLLKERPVDFVNFNKRQLSRIYPKGTRVDSSNYMPQVFWNAGCQMVALNFQTMDLGMQLNLGLFEYNGRSGYLLKPDFMRRADRRFDPFTESTVDGIIAGTVAVKIISGQFLSDKRTGTFVEVDMFGLPADTVRRRRTKTVANNGLNPVYTYGDETFTFKKVVLPDLACLRIAAYEESGKLIGHRILPVVGLRPGYRHISLRNDSSQPLLLPSLFVHITVKDYVPDGLSELADALANPIAYQTDAEKRANQLQALTDDSEVEKKPAHQVHAATKVVVSAETPDHRRAPPLSEARRATHSGTASSSGAPCSSGAARDSLTASSAADQSMNGGLQTRPPSLSCSASPAHPAPTVPPLLRQDTFSMRINQSVRSLSDDTGAEKPPSLLESAEAHISAESLTKLKAAKSVLKILSKMEKDLLSLRKKHDKIREKELSLIHQREDKIIHAQEKQKSALAKTHSKLTKKSVSTEASGTSLGVQALASVQAASQTHGSLLAAPGSTSPGVEQSEPCIPAPSSSPTPAPASRTRTRRQSLQFLVSSVPSLHRNLLKRRSELDLQHALQDQQAQLDELHRNCAQSLLSTMKDHLEAELALYEKYHEQVYAALEKTMQVSQSAQLASLQSMHDQEVSTLMKRLEAQNKEDLTSLGKKHKDKNELARIKRELQQRLIDQAVAERTRFTVLLNKRKEELEARHQEVRLKLEEEKEEEIDKRRHDLAGRLQALQSDFDDNPAAFAQHFSKMHLEKSLKEKGSGGSSAIPSFLCPSGGGEHQSHIPSSSTQAGHPPRPASSS